MHTNLVILKLPRTGSSYLVHLLNSHGQVSVVPEYPNELLPAILGLRHKFGKLGHTGKRINKWLHAGKVEKLRRYLLRKGKSGCIGFSMNPLKEEITREDLHRILNPASRVITLSRDNYLKQYLSYLNVQREVSSGTGRPYHSYRPEAGTQARQFTLSNSAVQVQRLREKHQAFVDLTRDLPCPQLALSYETDLNRLDKSALFEKLAAFLEVESSGCWESYRPGIECDGEFHKLLSDNLSDLIANYEDIRDDEALKPFL